MPALRSRIVLACAGGISNTVDIDATIVIVHIAEAILNLPDRIWEPVYDAYGQVRPCAWVAGDTRPAGPVLLATGGCG